MCDILGLMSGTIEKALGSQAVMVPRLSSQHSRGLGRFSDFEASLVYTVNSRIARAT